MTEFSSLDTKCKNGNVVEFLELHWKWNSIFCIFRMRCTLLKMITTLVELNQRLRTNLVNWRKTSYSYPSLHMWATLSN